MGRLKRWWRGRRPYLLADLIYGLVRLVLLTVRIRVENESYWTGHPGGKIMCGWHGKSVLPAMYLRGKGTWAIFSQSNDGEMQTRIFRRFGFRAIRGSTGRGGARALIESIRVLRQGEAMALTPDGPRGPSRVVQPGIIAMAQKSGAALVPCGIAAKGCWRAKSWDRYMVPKPFARGLIVLGEPQFVPSTADAAELEGYRLRLESAIRELDEEAERRVGNAPVDYPSPRVVEA